MTEHNNPPDNITVSRELLRQIFECISRSRETAMHQTLVARIPESGLFGGIAQDLDFAETALRKALEQPAVEPSAVFYRCNHCGHGYEDQPPSSCDCSTGYGFERVEYFTAPQAQQPAKEKS